MKKILFFLFCASTLAACTKDFSNLTSNHKTVPTTRSGGDNKFDVLGWGYDVTEDYLNPTSVRGQVIDIEKYEREFPNRLITHTNSWGSDFFCYGATAEDYLKEVTKKSNMKGGLNMGVGKFGFSGTFSSSKDFFDSYSYSTKYAFASLECIRNHRIIYINDDISRISAYISPEFIEDVNRYSAEKIIEIYGTHVLTHITLGGRYRLMYRSCFTKTTDQTTRKKTVAAGFSAVLGKLGIKFNAGGETVTNEVLAKENASQELYVYFFGGKGSNLKYSLDQNYPTTIDIQNWDSQISLDGSSVLTNIEWNKAYPIYEFISNASKKTEVKNAIEQYIANKQITSLKLTPFYEMWYSKSKDTYYVYSWDTVLNEQQAGREFKGLKGYILATQTNNTVPLYAMWYNETKDTFYTTSWEAVQNDIKQGREYKGQAGYILKNPANNTIPLYPMWYGKNKDSFYTYSWAEVTEQVKQGREYKGGIVGYIYNAY